MSIGPQLSFVGWALYTDVHLMLKALGRRFGVPAIIIEQQLCGYVPDRKSVV